MRIEFCCDDMRDAIVNQDLELDLCAGCISVVSGGSSIIFCPWCGSPVEFTEGSG